MELVINADSAIAKCNVYSENSEASSSMKCSVGAARDIIAEIARKGAWDQCRDDAIYARLNI